jgi:hypothetical protein
LVENKLVASCEEKIIEEKENNKGEGSEKAEKQSMVGELQSVEQIARCYELDEQSDSAGQKSKWAEFMELPSLAQVIEGRNLLEAMELVDDDSESKSMTEEEQGTLS